MSKLLTRRRRDVEYLLSTVDLDVKTAKVDHIKLALRCLEGRKYVKDAVGEFIALHKSCNKA